MISSVRSGPSATGGPANNNAYRGVLLGCFYSSEYSRLGAPGRARERVFTGPDGESALYATDTVEAEEESACGGLVYRV